MLKGDSLQENMHFIVIGLLFLYVFTHEYIGHCDFIVYLSKDISPYSLSELFKTTRGTELVAVMILVGISFCYFSIKNTALRKSLVALHLLIIVLSLSLYLSKLYEEKMIELAEVDLHKEFIFHHEGIEFRNNLLFLTLLMLLGGFPVFMNWFRNRKLVD